MPNARSPSAEKNVSSFIGEVISCADLPLARAKSDASRRCNRSMNIRASDGDPAIVPPTSRTTHFDPVLNAEWKWHDSSERSPRQRPSQSARGVIEPGLRLDKNTKREPDNQTTGPIQ